MLFISCFAMMCNNNFGVPIRIKLLCISILKVDYIFQSIELVEECLKFRSHKL